MDCDRDARGREPGASCQRKGQKGREGLGVHGSQWSATTANRAQSQSEHLNDVIFVAHNQNWEITSKWSKTEPKFDRRKNRCKDLSLSCRHSAILLQCIARRALDNRIKS
jgi:hypothetical protein